MCIRASEKGLVWKWNFETSVCYSNCKLLTLNQQTEALKFHFQAHLINLVPVRVSLMCKNSVKATIHHARHR